MTTNEVKEVLGLLCAAYPAQRAKLRDHDLRRMLQVWCLAMADIAFDVAKAAAGRIVQTSKWLPSIAEFRAECGVVQSGGSGPRAGIDAWGDVHKLLEFREGIEGVDPLVLYVCKQLGWVEYRTLWRNGQDIEQWHVVHGENESSDRARFAELYDKQIAAGIRQGQLAEGGKIPQLKAPAGPRMLGDTLRGMLPSGEQS